MIPEIEPVNNYFGNNSNTRFDFDFLINSSDELLVLYTGTNGVQTPLALNTDYSINEIGNTAGSYITFPLAGSAYSVLSTDESLSLVLNLPYEQISRFSNSTGLNLYSIEQTFDYVTRLTQMLKRSVDRAVTVPEGASTITAEDILAAANTALSAKNSILTNVTVNTDGFGCAGDGLTDDSADFEAGIASLGSEEVSVIVNGEIRLSHNFTVPKNVQLVFNHFSKLKPDSGVTITLEQKPNAPFWQIFDGAGNIIIQNADEVYPEWFGAKANGHLGAAANDDAAAIQKAIFAVSPITTDSTGLTLANFTVGVSSFDSTNVYRFGGKVKFQNASYRFKSTIYNNPYVTLEGEGHVGIAYREVTTAKGTVLDFQPDTATNKVAIANIGFDSRTGGRYDPTILNISASDNYISRNYCTQVKNLSINCKSGTLVGLKVARAVGATISNVSILSDGTSGGAIVGMNITSDWGSAIHNVNITATTIGILIFGITTLAQSGYCYVNQVATKTTLPYSLTSLPDTDEKDKHSTMSTGIYAVYGGQITWNGLIAEGWDRAIFANNCNWILNTPYTERIGEDLGTGVYGITFNISNSNMVINSPLVYSSNAALILPQFARSSNQGQIAFNGGFSRNSTFKYLVYPDSNFTLNALTGKYEGLSNHEYGVRFETPTSKLVPTSDTQQYDFIKFKNDEKRELTKLTTISLIRSVLSDPLNLVSSWFDDVLQGSTIKDYVLGHDMSFKFDDTSVSPVVSRSANLSEIDQKDSGIARSNLYITNATGSYYSEAADHNDFSFGNGISDNAFSLIVLLRFVATVSQPIFCKRDMTTGSTKTEYYLSTSGGSGLYFGVEDNVHGGNKSIFTGNLAGLEGQLLSVIATYDGSGAEDGLNIYVNGILQSITGNSSGSYTAMCNTTSKLASYRINADGTKTYSDQQYFFRGLVKEELTAAMVANIDRILRLGYAGLN